MVCKKELRIKMLEYNEIQKKIQNHYKINIQNFVLLKRSVNQFV